jgi:tetratricopeptide (TPR) repeat protein
MRLSEELLQTWEHQLRRGNGRDVRSALEMIGSGEIPRPLVANLALMALRAGLLERAYRILSPFVRTSGDLKGSTPLERAVFALLLREIGSLDEAENLLQNRDVNELPETLLYKSLLRFSNWDYLQAIPLLEQYLENRDLSLYARTVGQTNLAAALVAERDYVRAGALVSEVLDLSKTNGFHMLHGNALEILAQSQILRGQIEDGKQTLRKARDLLKNSKESLLLFVDKWSAIAELFQDGPSVENLRMIQVVRDRAIQIKHWPSVRECDWWRAKFSKDSALFRHLYFGTPSAPYRMRILANFDESANIPEQYDWTIGENIAGATPVPVLEVEQGHVLESATRLPQRQLQHRLLQTLASDFYTPLKVGVLFAAAYRGEFFNPVSSPSRVYNGISRLNKWFITQGLPLKIAFENGGFKLEAIGPCVIRVGSFALSGSGYDQFLTSIDRRFNDAKFSSSEAAKTLNVPQRTLVRLLSEAVTKGDLRRTGEARGTRYQRTIVPGRPLKAA